MSKIIHTNNAFYTELTYYEKYIKLGNKDIQPFMKFSAVSFITTVTADISLIIGFRNYIFSIILISFFMFLISIYLYLRFYKKPNYGFSFYTF